MVTLSRKIVAALAAPFVAAVTIGVFAAQRLISVGSAPTDIAILAILAAVIVIGMVYVSVFVTTELKQVQSLTKTMRELAAGHFDAKILYTGQHDEVGDLAGAMVALEDRVVTAERERDSQIRLIVDDIGTALAEIAKGNLSYRVMADVTSPLARLAQDFNSAASRLDETLRGVMSSVNNITTSAGEIASAADDLSHRTEQQAAVLEETAAAMEEINDSVQNATMSTSVASVSVTSAKVCAEDGGQVVETAIAAMDTIAQSSQQITDIISVMDEIAFQTNLLALNAGIEAARAGDSGRGFAVVAAEVRALAQRSGKAAKQIKDLINISREHVASGVKYVGGSGETLKDVVGQIALIDGFVSEMAQTAERQAKTLAEINAAVSQMDRVTQQNAAMVEQSTAASRSLASEARALTDLVSFFQVGCNSNKASTTFTVEIDGPAATSVAGNLTVVPAPQDEEKSGEEFCSRPYKRLGESG